MKETFREMMREKDIKRMFQFVEPISERTCESCGGFDKNSEGFCQRLVDIQGEECWYPEGTIHVEEEDVDKGVSSKSTSIRIEG